MLPPDQLLLNDTAVLACTRALTLTCHYPTGFFMVTDNDLLNDLLDYSKKENCIYHRCVTLIMRCVPLSFCISCILPHLLLCSISITCLLQRSITCLLLFISTMTRHLFYLSQPLQFLSSTQCTYLCIYVTSNACDLSPMRSVCHLPFFIPIYIPSLIPISTPSLSQWPECQTVFSGAWPRGQRESECVSVCVRVTLN